MSYLRTNGNTRTGKGLEPSSECKRLKVVRMAFEWALTQNWILRNPFSGLKSRTVTVNYDRMVYISKADCMAVIDSTTNQSHKALIALIRFCGLRGSSELSRLTWNEDCIRYGKNGEQGELVVHSVKTDGHAGHERRTIPLTNYVEGILNELRMSQPEGTERMFPDMKESSNPGVVVKKIFRRYGIDIKRMYNLRLSYATDLMAGGLHERDPKAFELFCGHDVAVSLKRYQIINEERKRNAVNKFCEIMENGVSDSENCSEKNLTTSFTTYSVRCSQYRNNSQHLPVINSNIDLSLKNKSCFKKEKAPARNCKGERYPQQESNLQPTD